MRQLAGAEPESITAALSGVESVIITSELESRPAPAPDFAAECRTLLKLANTMVQQPHRVLQELVDSAKELCLAGSAGVSLLDPEESGPPAQFRWVATSGEFSRLTGNTLPRNFSPCGTVLDANRMLLMSDPVRYFPYIEMLPQPVREVLLVPFYRDDEPIGTVWVAAHEKDRHFDKEDARLVTSLSQFAAAAVQVIATNEANRKLLESARLAAERELARVGRENQHIAGLLEEQRQADEMMSRELKDTRLLRDVAARLIGAGDTSAVFEEILTAAITITDADAGTIQLLDTPSSSLRILASRGFSPAMLSHFAQVSASSGSPCGIALARNERTFVLFDDPATPDPDDSLKLHRDSGLSCAQSTPLLSRSGQALGMFSTHWRARRELTDRELRFLDLLGRQAADLIERALVLEALHNSERELRQADRRKDEFLAVLAHELRNPLVPIRNGIEMLKRVRTKPELVEQVIPMMERQVAHVVRLIDDLLDVSRITSGKIVLQRQPVALASLIESAIESNRATIAAESLELKVQLDQPDRLIDVDSTRFSQVISNLLQNAGKFTPAGGEIMIRGWFSADTGNPELVLRVSDTGIGIPEEQLTAVFGLFAQLHSDGTKQHAGLKQQAGLGIGLAIARSLIELHGGSIDATSGGLGKGSVFTIRMPVPAGCAARTLKPVATEDLTGHRVLVVDDNQDAADSMGLLIAEFGAEVRVAYDARQALEILEEFDASLVLLDIGMPGIDGYEACREIRGVKGAAVCIFALTGWGQAEDRRRTAEAGFDAHLTKPVNLAQLLELAGSKAALA